MVVVVSAHNKYQDIRIKNNIQGAFERFANPHTPYDDVVRSLIVVSGIDQDTNLSPVNPYDDWMALAPAWRVFSTEPLANTGYVIESGASYCTCDLNRGSVG